jgi:benzil reductase ((S)-benzoin forming)
MHVFITGVSSGIGMAFLEHYLNEGAQITGIGRTKPSLDGNYSFLTCDFSDITRVKRLSLQSNDDELIFINNAGTIGSIQRVSEQNASDLEEVMTVNTIVPMLFSQKVILENPGKKITLLNISSGAANRPIPSWAAYCSSKIALDRFSETLQLEEDEKKATTRIYSVAPGVVDTKMQQKIRQCSEVDFSSIKNFTDLYENGELTDPKLVVNKLVKLISQQEKTGVIYAIKDLD